MIDSRGLYIILSAAIASIGTYYAPDVFQKSPAALAGVISVFSILAGVLVAVISIIGDPSMLLTGNWRLGHEHAKEIQKRISNYANLIVLYVVVLIGVLLLMVFKDAQIAGRIWVSYIVQWLTSFGLLLSIPLPYSLMNIQKDRMNEEIKRRKRSSGDNGC